MRQKGEGIYRKEGNSDLWEQFREGDADAFAELYNLYADALASYGYRISNDLSIVKDAIQDLFVELWRSKNNLQPVFYVKAYLFKSLRYKLLRYGKLNLLLTTDERLSDELADEFSIESKIFRKEEEAQTAEKIRLALKTLSKRQQEAVTLKFYHGFTNEQVAEIMNVNYQSATNILHRSMLILRKHFSLTVLISIHFYSLLKFF